MITGTSSAKERIIFGGGPAGGTFQVVANGIQLFKPVEAEKNFIVKAQASKGSIDNLQKTDAGKQQMSVVYSSHIWLGRNGKLEDDPKKHENVLAVARLYSATAQMVVRAGLGINSVEDLVGKKVAVGNPGSAAFANCRLFFTHMGIWDKIERIAIGYNDAAMAFGNMELDAFWLFTAFPSGAVIMAAQTTDIVLLDLNADAEASGFYDKYPFFSKFSVPMGTYRGVDYDAPSFQESAVWVANSKVPADVVYKMLSLIYSDEGLKHMLGQRKTFRNMSLETGTIDIVTPLHPGAKWFWLDKTVAKIDNPEFPWPPPQTSASNEIPHKFFNRTLNKQLYLSDIEQTLIKALDSAGYYERSYYAVPDGFALVTRLERINYDGTSKEGHQRWKTNIGPLRKFNLTEFLKRLFTAEKGFFRIVVFIVTPHPFAQSNAKIRRKDAIEWLSSGLNILPDPIGDVKYSDNYNCHALIYEFEKVRHRQAKIIVPGNLDGRTHLVKAKLWTYWEK
jgi:TRAP transporter TAXI family solute receptor